MGSYESSKYFIIMSQGVIYSIFLLPIVLVTIKSFFKKEDIGTKILLILSTLFFLVLAILSFNNPYWDVIK